MKNFTEANKHNLSKYAPEERFKYYNWLKHNRQLMNAGEMKPERVEMMGKLVDLWEERKRVNQYV